MSSNKKCSDCAIENENENKIRNNPTNTNTFNPTINVNPVINTPPSSSPVCPPATQPNEPPECEQRRQQIHGDVFVAPNGWEFAFNNVLQDFPALMDPSNLNSCEGVHGGGFHLAPFEELLVISNAIIQSFRVNGQPLCTMLIWSTISGSPTLLYFIPGSPNPFIVVPTPSIFCLAYSICINSGG